MERKVVQRVARSLRDVARGNGVGALELVSSEDLVCKNLMCERVGEACVCRLALALERSPEVQTMDVSRNALPDLPEQVFKLSKLKYLNASNNALKALPAAVEQLQNLETLDLRHNQLKDLPEEALEALPKLSSVYVEGNAFGIDSIKSEKLRKAIKEIKETQKQDV